MKIYKFGNNKADIILVQPVDEHDLSAIENEIAFIKQEVDKDFGLIAVKVDDWNNDLSPWPMKAVFGNHDFGSGASKTLNEILKLCDDKNKTYYIGGYSLAALFSLWAVYQTNIFSGVASASPSMWFEGFVDCMKNNQIKTNKVYLSLGDKEDKTRNQIMATVKERIEISYSFLKEKGVNTTLEWNKGNHFQDFDLRVAKAFIWLMKN